MGLLAGSPIPCAAQELLRYRGEFTYGHEVEIFCPEINSQCYWLDPGTDFSIRNELRELAAAPDAPPYTPVCVVVEGRIDRTSARTGFAAEYDGLVTVTEIFGQCDETTIITQGDLQHHRWLLESINGTGLDFDERLPELDFGERMNVFGNLGCRRFSGTAELRGPYVTFFDILPENRQCEPARNAIERIMFNVLDAESAVTIDEERHLILSFDGIELQFRLEDWK
jgi:heat shock protein HslJ